MRPGVPQLEICDEAVMNWAPAGCEVMLGDFFVISNSCVILFTGTWPLSAQAGVSALQVLLAALGSEESSERVTIV